jgi:predicted alpha/beta hydrolase family esterase
VLPLLGNAPNGLAEIMSIPGDEPIYRVAHSAGSIVVLGALADIAHRGGHKVAGAIFMSEAEGAFFSPALTTAEDLKATQGAWSPGANVPITNFTGHKRK